MKIIVMTAFAVLRELRIAPTVANGPRLTGS